MTIRTLCLSFAAAVLIGLPGAVRAETFIANLSGAHEFPAVATNATGYARVFLNESTGSITFSVVFNNLSSNQIASHIHTGAIGVNGPISINFGAVGGTSGTISGTSTITPSQIATLREHGMYVNVHSANFSAGEIRGQLGIKRPVDFDGDGRQDPSVVRFPNVAPPGVAPLTYWNLNSTTGIQTSQWGDANLDAIAPGDYDGDGKDDLAIYRAGVNPGDPSVFFIFRSTNSTYLVIPFGANGDLAVSRDFDGDGITDPTIFRRGASVGAQAFWWIRRSTTGTDTAVPWGTTGVSGNSGDLPVPGDYDGDGKFDVAVYRFGGIAPNNAFIILRSSDNTSTYAPWGNFSSDYIVPGDYDGDGKYDVAVARTGSTAASPLVWWIRYSSDGTSRTQTFGRSSDLPAQGDYDGDARADIAIYRSGATATAPSNFWVMQSSTNSATVTPWGQGSDFAVNTFDIR